MINEKWIWVNRQDGKKEQIAPWEITDELDSNPIISLASPRPDFNGSLIQFLIGLVQTTMSPRNERDWRKYFINPPKPDELHVMFGEVSDAFNLDGENERFMQDYEHFEDIEKCKEVDISQLLIDVPGGKTIEDNTDHFIKRNTVSKMCFSCCAVALFTLQTNAPQGGRGYLTSLRGGGPLTTVILGDNLWQTIWLNIIPEVNFENLGDISKSSINEIFPWMGFTRTTGNKEMETSSMDVNPKQMYWGMPRRKRVDFKTTKKGFCDVCGCKSDQLVVSYFRKTYGNDYNGTWCHVLTPYYLDGAELIPKHLGKEGVLYRHWLGLVQNDSENGGIVSKVVDRLWTKQNDILDFNILKSSPRLWAFGYDFDKNNARCWYESIMPLFNVPENIKSDYEHIVLQLVKTADIISENTRGCIKKALFKDKLIKGKDKPIKNFTFFIDSRFWHDTESDYYNVLSELIPMLETNSDTVNLKIQWVRSLSKVSEKLFDEYSQSMQFSVVDPERIAIARRDLRRYNYEGGKKIRETLGAA
nr:type I-E CRISPR-associated protein Cse1/CasA [uncultured Methanolobus sp.]